MVWCAKIHNLTFLSKSVILCYYFVTEIYILPTHGSQQIGQRKYPTFRPWMAHCRIALLLFRVNVETIVSWAQNSIHTISSYLYIYSFNAFHFSCSVFARQIICFHLSCLCAWIHWKWWGHVFLHSFWDVPKRDIGPIWTNWSSIHRSSLICFNKMLIKVLFYLFLLYFRFLVNLIKVIIYIYLPVIIIIILTTEVYFPSW